METQDDLTLRDYAVCSRSLDQLYIVSHGIKLVKISWTNSKHERMFFDYMNLYCFYDLIFEQGFRLLPEPTSNTTNILL